MHCLAQGSKKQLEAFCQKQTMSDQVPNSLQLIPTFLKTLKAFNMQPAFSVLTEEHLQLVATCADWKKPRH